MSEYMKKCKNCVLNGNCLFQDARGMHLGRRGENMKVRALIEAIERGKKDYSDFLDWEVYSEQVDVSRIPETDKIKDEDEWVYVKLYGFNTYMPKEKIFTVNHNY